MSQFRIVTIDGGGTRAYFMYDLLKRIQSTTPFTPDLVVGVSAGAIIAALYATGMLTTLDDTVARAMVAGVFGTKTELGVWFGPMYDGGPKSRALWSLFGDRTLGSSAVPLAIVVDRLHGDPYVFQSWDAAHRDTPLWQILDATSAIPALLPPVPIRGELHVDGGVATNCPEAVAYLLAKGRGVADADLRMLSLGIARRDPIHARPDHDAQPGILRLLGTGMPLKVLEGNSVLCNSLVRALLGPRLLRIEGRIDGEIDDVHVTGRCIDESHRVWSRHHEAIRAFLRDACGLAVP